MFEFEPAFLSLLVLFLAVVMYYLQWNKKKRMPPGPTGYPIVGNALHVDINSPMKQLAKWRKEFGDIFKINLFGQDIVVVSSYELMKDVLVRKQEIFSGRPTFHKISPYTHHQEDVVLSSGSPIWKLKKKAMLTSMKMYGEELLKLEKVTLECIREALQSMENTKGKPFNPRPIIHLLVQQILAVLQITGCQLPESQSKTLMESEHLAHKRHFSAAGPGVELEFFPWLRYFGHPVWKEIVQNAEVMWTIYEDMLNKRKAVLDLNSPQCVIDGLLLQQATEKYSGEKSILTDEILICMTVNIFEAGVNTTLFSTLALLGIMANHPEVQEKIHREIDAVIGNEEPRLKHRHEMHYISACLHELIRYITVNPLHIPHMATEDGELGSYFIPKGTQIWCNTWELNHDPDYWDDPWKFQPERFLDEQGQLVTLDHPNRRRLLSFGAGKRICVGEVLAKNRMFLFVACLFQKFKFLPVKGDMAPKHDPRTYQYSIVTMIDQYEVIAASRSNGEY